MSETSWIEAYLLATENEIAVDVHLYSISGGRASEFGYLPRPSRWRGMSAKLRPVLRVVGTVSRALWNVGAARAYLTYDARRLERHRQSCMPAPPKLTMECRELAIAFSSRAADVLHIPALSEEPRQWITFPWVPIHPLPADQAQVDAFSLLTSEDIERARLLAIRASAELRRRPSTRLWALQSYTAMRWFAACIALAKFTQCRLLIAEHYDRWAVLADAIARTGQGNTLTLVQHGALAGLSANGETPSGRLHFPLPHPLTSVSRLSVYDADSQSVFLRDVLTPKCVARGVDVRTFKPTIELRQMNTMGRASLLIVGHTLCEPLHIALMNQLSRDGIDVEVFYKPHPTAAPGNHVARQSWHVIDERSVFPAVDLIVAYPSTLVTEYANVGVPAIVHALDATPEAATKLSGEIQTRLTGKATAVTVG